MCVNSPFFSLSLSFTRKNGSQFRKQFNARLFIWTWHQHISSSSSSSRDSQWQKQQEKVIKDGTVKQLTSFPSPFLYSHFTPTHPGQVIPGMPHYRQNSLCRCCWVVASEQLIRHVNKIHSHFEEEDAVQLVRGIAWFAITKGCKFLRIRDRNQNEFTVKERLQSGKRKLRTILMRSASDFIAHQTKDVTTIDLDRSINGNNCKHPPNIL